VPTVSWAGNIQDGGSGGKVAVSITDGGSIGQVMIFSGTHTYSGATTILRNTMQAGATGVFSANSEFILSNNTESTLDLNGFDNAVGALSGANASSRVLLGAGTLTVGSLGYSGTFNGIISGTGGVIKTGSGSLNLTGANTYTGDTTVNNGILALDGAAIPDTNKLSINSGGAVGITGNETVSTLFIEGVEMAEGTYGATDSGAAHIDDTHFTGTGVLTVGAGYDSWAALNAGGQTAGLDYDMDGVSNGVEYFMNAATGFTANPGIVSGSVTWTNGGNIPSSAYGTQFVVQTSVSLTSWTDVALGDPNLGTTAGSVSYTLPTGSGKLFVRLVVMAD
jgi:autotransporter-associated beta strand protein